MPQQISIDDKNTSLIQYSGSWQFLEGSTREWENGAHTTSEEGANATFRFRGYQVWLWGTIPAGTGTNIIDISVDGSAPNITSRTSNGSTVYNEQYYASPILRDTYHTLVVTNRGSSSKGNSEFLLDRFEFETSDEVPSFSTPDLTTSPGAPTATVTLSAPSTSSKTPWGAIIGALVAVFVVVIAALVFVLMRRHRRQGLSISSEKADHGEGGSVTPTPFPLSSPRNLTTHSPSSRLPPLRSLTQSDSELNSSPPQLSVLTSAERSSEKSENSHQHQLFTISPFSPMSQSDHDNSTLGYGSHLVSSPSTSQPSNPGQSIHHVTLMPIAPGVDEVPPPSYW